MASYRISPSIVDGQAHAYLAHQDEHGEWWDVTDAPAGELHGAVQEYLSAVGSELSAEDVIEIGRVLLDWHEAAHAYATAEQGYGGTVEDFMALPSSERQTYEDGAAGI